VYNSCDDTRLIIKQISYKRKLHDGFHIVARQRLCRSAVATGTHLHMLTRLDQFAHQGLQLVVPLDQVGQVGVQGLL